MSYLTVGKECESSVTINRSRFICSIKGIENEEEAKAYIAEIKRRYELASSFAYAYIADQFGHVLKFYDGGEPQGTAGMPIYNVLKNKQLCKVVAVVTRYFGGIKLGAGGLVRAFSGVTAECVNSAEIKEIKRGLNFKISVDYDIYAKLQRYLPTRNYFVKSTEFNREVELKILVEEINDNYAETVVKDLSNFANGKIYIERLEDTMQAF